jgi:hypothetical protein
MSVYKSNVKNTREKDGWKAIKCKCGCTRIEAKYTSPEDSDWVEISCKRCGNVLFYNGA